VTTWFTSDEHYGHRNIIEYSGRPFANVDEMTRELIARHNAAVSKDDEVWHLGDFSLDERLVPQILPQLKGRHRLVVGNHDRCHPCHKKSNGATRRYLLYGFETVSFQVHMGPWLLNHLPYVGDSSHEARYPEWRPKDDGRWLLHGHVHELWKVRDRMINVGVDQWDYRPVALNELEKMRTLQ
jgi:calcineurin-like phosphoesterase family protein